MVLGVDAAAFAFASARTATVAFVSVDYGFEKRKTRQKAQDCSYRTDSIAISTACTPCKTAMAMKLMAAMALTA